MTDEEKAKAIARKAAKSWGLNSNYNKVCYDAAMKMARWKDKQFVKELRKVLEFSASPVDMEDEINNLIQKYENQ